MEGVQNFILCSYKITNNLFLIGGSIFLIVYHKWFGSCTTHLISYQFYISPNNFDWLIGTSQTNLATIHNPTPSARLVQDYGSLKMFSPFKEQSM
jgi:hypothetical protein